jgi:hypothetical protein
MFLAGLVVCRATLFDTSDLLCDAANSLIDDSFFRCFTSAAPDPWNWNWYLFPMWLLGTFLRYFILFPLRALMLAVCLLMFFAAFFPLQVFLKVLPGASPFFSTWFLARSAFPAVLE